MSVGLGAGTLSADGDTDEQKVQGDGGLHVHFSGTFGSGTITVYFQTREATPAWKAIAGSARTAADDLFLRLPHGTQVKATLAGASGPSLFWHMYSART